MKIRGHEAKRVPCPKCGELILENASRCIYCDYDEKQKQKTIDLENPPDLLVSSTPLLDGYVIDEYLGYVSAETAMGLGVFKSLSAGISDLVGVEAKGLGEKFSEAKGLSFAKVLHEAARLGANAVVGLNIEITSVGDLAVVMSKGTAVRIHKNKNHQRGRHETIFEEK